MDLLRRRRRKETRYTSRTHLKTENESIKRDERERIGHHADRTASVQVCVCFRTSLFSFFSIVPFTLRRRSAWGRERAHPPRGKNGSSFGKKSDAASPFESEISLSLLPLLLSPARCARVKCDGAVIIALRRRKRRRRRTLCSSFFFIFFVPFFSLNGNFFFSLELS